MGRLAVPAALRRGDGARAAPAGRGEGSGRLRRAGVRPADEAAALHEEAAALYEDAGAAGQAALSRACALLARAELPPATDTEEDGDGEGVAAKAAALGDAHAGMVRLHEQAPALAPYLEARLLRLRATVLGLRLQTTRQEEHVAPVLAEVDLLHAFAVRHDIASQISGAALLRAGTHALTGDLPAAVTELDALQERLQAHGPAWHLPRALGLRGRLRLGMRDAQAAHADLTEALRVAADWPAHAMDTGRLHADLAEACLHLGRPEEALRHLSRAAQAQLRHGSRIEALCTYSNAAQLSLDLGRVEDSIALLDSLLAEPDVAAGQLDARLTAQLRLTRARALHTGEDLKAATAEFVALAAESAGWDDDPGSHAMIAAETAVLLAESGEFGRAREAAGQAIAAHARAPRYEQLSNCLRELARLQAKQQGADGLTDALGFLDDAARIAEEARTAGYEAGGRPLDVALAYEHGRVHAYAGTYEEALAALEKGLALLGEAGAGDEHAGEWAECVRLAGAVEASTWNAPRPPWPAWTRPSPGSGPPATTRRPNRWPPWPRSCGRRTDAPAVRCRGGPPLRHRGAAAGSGVGRLLLGGAGAGEPLGGRALGEQDDDGDGAAQRDDAEERAVGHGAQAHEDLQDGHHDRRHPHAVARLGVCEGQGAQHERQQVAADQAPGLVGAGRHGDHDGEQQAQARDGEVHRLRGPHTGGHGQREGRGEGVRVGAARRSRPVGARRAVGGGSGGVRARGAVGGGSAVGGRGLGRPGGGVRGLGRPVRALGAGR